MKRPVAWLKLWPLWEAPGALVAYLLGVVSVFVAASAVQLVRFQPRLDDLAVYLVLLACAWMCVEATRRLGEQPGIVRDLQSAWTLPIALLLPPVYALLAPVPLKTLSQLRVGRSLIYRRVLSAAVIGLAHFVASEAFHRMLPAGGLSAAMLLDPGRTVLSAFGCATLCYVVNTALVTTAVRLAAPETTWRQLLLDRESLYIDLVEVCIGVIVFAAWTVTSAAIVVLLPPAMLLQRSLTYAQMRTAARTDAKTGLLNAAAWQEVADREIVRAHRERRPLAIFMIDLDLFKGFNDTHGHLAGDRALAAVAAGLVSGLRVYDQLGRFGGEEFSVVLPNADQAEAERVAERLRRSVAELAVPGVDPSARVTVSIGAAMVGTHGIRLIDLLAAADVALYLAKAGGRNRVAFAPGLPVAAPPLSLPSPRWPADRRPASLTPDSPTHET